MAGPLSLMDEFTWMANKGAMKMNLLKSLRSYLASIALGLMCLSYANAKEGLVIPIWPEGVPGAHVNAGPEKHVDGRYYNTGDFVESCSYIIESIDGKMELKYI